MNKTNIAAFFDSLADSWDADMVRNQHKIDEILDIASVSEGKSVLDVACGTGVLIPDYICRRVSRCVAVDISPKMIEIAVNKFSEYGNIEFVCADAETKVFFEKFDCIVIYNAFPHFTDRDRLFKNLSKSLAENGRITVAHGMSREALIRHHSGSAREFSSILPEADELAKIMKPCFDVDKIISTDEIYIVSGKSY